MLTQTLKKAGRMSGAERLIAVAEYGRKVNEVLQDMDERFYCDGLGIYFRDGDIGEYYIGYLTLMNALTIPADEMAVRIIIKFAKGEC